MGAFRRITLTLAWAGQGKKVAWDRSGNERRGLVVFAGGVLARFGPTGEAAGVGGGLEH